MATFTRPARAIDIATRHGDHVHLVAEGETAPIGIEGVSSSWQRSAKKYRIDPDTIESPRILSPFEVKELREPIDKLIFGAQEEIDRLYKVVRDAGYVILLCDKTGTAVEHRGENADASQFKYWGTWLGGVWSEEVEGTNGIGTCIVEERPITVHRGQHYRSRHIDLSCSGAPIFDVDGKLLAVLDVSAVDPARSESAHALTGAVVTASARAIEERFFREQFRQNWVVAVAPPEEDAAGMLLAVDKNHRLVGANRAARTWLLLDDDRLRAGVSLWSVFERDPTLFRRQDAGDVPTRLIVAGSDESWPALVTVPERNSGMSQNSASAALHARPRLELLGAFRRLEPPPQARGGLSLSVERRVREYVETHLGDSIDLAALAAIAGLSVYHFARAFKQSTGVTPHHYLIKRRVERAQEMLACSRLPLPEVALATGFSDQSHLTRHFRQLLGTSPGQFRRSLR